MDTEIKIQASIEDMRIDKLPFFLALAELGTTDIDIVDQCKLNAIFTGIELDQMKKYSADANRDLFDTIMSVCKHEPKPIPLELTYEGQKYTFRHLDFTHNSIDWIDDLRNAQENFKTNPIDLVSFCYIEDGLSYGEPDEHQNQKNPRSVRNEVFAKHLPITIYFDVSAFFLLSWNAVQQFLHKGKAKRHRFQKRK